MYLKGTPEKLKFGKVFEIHKERSSSFNVKQNNYMLDNFLNQRKTSEVFNKIQIFRNLK